MIFGAPINREEFSGQGRKCRITKASKGESRGQECTRTRPNTGQTHSIIVKLRIVKKRIATRHEIEGKSVGKGRRGSGDAAMMSLLEIGGRKREK